MWSDNETKTDFLNFEDTVGSVTDILRRKDLHPLSLGLFGGWGSGKSSLLQMVMEEMEKGPDTIVIYFDAWRFQGYDDARAALLETIGQKLYDIAADNVGFKDKAFSLLGRIDRLRTLGLLAEGTAMAMGLPAFGSILRGMEGMRDTLSGNGDADDLRGIKDAKAKTKGLIKPKEVSTPPQEIESFRAELNELLTEMGKSLYVFIDNLDRCLPKNAIHTLEAVRLFLFMEQTAFVIAADEEMIRVAVRDHYKADSKRLVTDYLDKLVQYPVSVPSVGVNELKSMLIMLMLTRDPDINEEKVSSIRGFLISKLQQSWKEAFPSADDIIAQFAADELTSKDQIAIHAAYQVSRTAAPILASAAAVQGNPRIVKRLLNTVSQRQGIATKRGIKLGEAALLKLVIFERCVGTSATLDLFGLVTGSKDGKVPILSEWEKNGNPPETRPSSWQPHDKFITAWCSLEPKLGTKDLRAAVYLSRDLQPVGTGTNTLSEQAQEAFKTLSSATSRNRQSTKDAILIIPGPEKMIVMGELIDLLDAIEDWERSFKKLWTGAVALANSDKACLDALNALITRKFAEKPPKWTKPALSALKEIDF